MIPHIRQVFVSNYKSLRRVATSLEPFTLLVGPNGAGKSNFIDCLAFVQEAVAESLATAVRNRGGFASLVWRGGQPEGHETMPPASPSDPAWHHAESDAVDLRLVLELADGFSAEYGMGLVQGADGSVLIAKEHCALRRAGEQDVSFEVDAGRFLREIPGIGSKLSRDHLALFAASATEEFAPVYDFLASMRFYSIQPSRLRELQEADSGQFLHRDGSNAAAVLKRLMEDTEKQATYERLCRLLALVAKGVKRVEPRPAGPKQTLHFIEERSPGVGKEFGPQSMSDGTLCWLGLLLAAYQPGQVSLLGIEEPEAIIHPAVAEVVAQVLLDAAHDQQILVTTHSPDLIDWKEFRETQIRVVASPAGETLVCRLSPGTQEAIRTHRFTPGELLRIDELNADLQGAVIESGGSESLVAVGPLEEDRP